jgi:phage-related protein
VKTPPFSAAARIEAGVRLRRLQCGESLGMPHSRPMPGIGRRCHELRIRDQGESWRVLRHESSDAIVVLDVFAKKTAPTPRSIIDQCKRRLSEFRRIVKERERK